MNKNIVGITDEFKEMMEDYQWPGNIRELEHFIENIMVRTKDNDRYLRVENIPSYILDTMYTKEKNNLKVDKESNLEDTLGNIEKDLIIKSLNKNRWNVTKTAEDLGVTRQSLNYRMKKLDINRNQ